MDPDSKPALLIVEADSQMSWLLETILAGEDREVLAAATVDGARALLRDLEPALVVLDLSRQEQEGRDLLSELRRRAATASMPVIALSGQAVPALKVDCYARGADAFFEKPVPPEILKAAVATHLRRFLDRRRGERVDLLTGLPNRAAFREEFRRLAALAERRRDAAALALIDCDRLASINKAHGVEAGDSALSQAAGILEKSVRQSDFLARWEGGTFALLLPSTSLEGARRAVSKALATLRRNTFRVPDGRTLHLSFSAGVVPVLPKFGVETVAGEAERYLRQAKSGGRKKAQPRYTR